MWQKDGKRGLKGSFLSAFSAISWDTYRRQNDNGSSSAATYFAIYCETLELKPFLFVYLFCFFVLFWMRFGSVEVFLINLIWCSITIMELLALCVFYIYKIID